ncbi:MAG: hypothetical protein NVSMB47_19230 [Polyangiales bacterium]
MSLEEIDPMHAAMRTPPATLSTLLGGAALALAGCSSSADAPTDATTPPDDSGVVDGGARDTADGGDGGDGGGLDAARADADARSDGGGLDAKDIGGDGGDGGDGGAVDCGPLSGHLVRARDFLDAWGVVYDPTSTDDLATTAKRLDEIGVRRLRAQLSITGLDPWKTLQAQMKSQHFARPRLQFEALVNAYNGEPGATPPSWTDQKGPLLDAARFYVYTLFDPSTGSPGVEPNFGIFTTDKSDKPAAVALSNVKHLFSLGLDYADPANESDTICFAPGYDGAGLRVDGIGESGHSSRVADAVVFPKSDGTTVISVTNEPTLCDGKGGDLTPAVVTATVHFGSAQTWHRYDVFGATPRVPVASGTGESVDVPLTGYPQYLLLDAPPGYHP